VKVTESYWPGLLFAPVRCGLICLGRTNELEHCLGSVRYGERYAALGRRGTRYCALGGGEDRYWVAEGQHPKKGWLLIFRALAVCRGTPQVVVFFTQRKRAFFRVPRDDLRARSNHCVSTSPFGARARLPTNKQNPRPPNHWAVAKPQSRYAFARFFFFLYSPHHPPALFWWHPPHCSAALEEILFSRQRDLPIHRKICLITWSHAHQL